MPADEKEGDPQDAVLPRAVFRIRIRETDSEIRRYGSGISGRSRNCWTLPLMSGTWSCLQTTGVMPRLRCIAGDFSEALPGQAL